MIDISNKNPVDVVLALFNNVYMKSAASNRTLDFIAEQCTYYKMPAPVGLDKAPTRKEIETLLEKHQGNIDYIGCVAIKMDFFNGTVDGTAYDSMHKTGKDSRLTAAECIQRVPERVKPVSHDRAIKIPEPRLGQKSVQGEFYSPVDTFLNYIFSPEALLLFSAVELCISVAIGAPLILTALWAGCFTYGAYLLFTQENETLNRSAVSPC